MKPKSIFFFVTVIIITVILAACSSSQPTTTPLDTQETTRPATTPPDTQEATQPATTPPDTQEATQPATTPPDAQETTQPATTPLDAQETTQPATAPPDTQEATKIPLINPGVEMGTLTEALLEGSLILEEFFPVEMGGYQDFLPLYKYSQPFKMQDVEVQLGLQFYEGIFYLVAIGEGIDTAVRGFIPLYYDTENQSIIALHIDSGKEATLYLSEGWFSW